MLRSSILVHGPRYALLRRGELGELVVLREIELGWRANRNSGAEVRWSGLCCSDVLLVND